MKKALLIVLLIICAVALVGCSSDGTTSGSDSNDNGTAPAAQEPEKLTNASEVVKVFKDEGFPIIDEIEYTSETDPNSLLGRPNQYIQKVNFNDSRFSKPIDPNLSEYISPDITIEVFASKSDLEKRYEYVKALSETSTALVGQYYIYKSDTMLFRITYDVTPEVAAKYEAVFLRVAK